MRAKDREFVEEFARCLREILGRDPLRPVRGKELFEVKAWSRALYDLLRKPIDIEGIKPFVEHSEECVRSFLRGFFDSEGCVEKYNRQIQCFNSDEQLIEYVRRLLHNLGIKTTGLYLNGKKGTCFYDKGMRKTYIKKRDV